MVESRKPALSLSNSSKSLKLVNIRKSARQYPFQILKVVSNLGELRRLTDQIENVIIYPSAADKNKNRGFAFVEYTTHR